MSATDAATVAAVLCHEYHPMHWDVAYGNRDKPCEACKVHARHLLAADPIAQALAAVEAVARVEALVEPQWYPNKGYAFDSTLHAFAAGRNQIIDRIRAALRPGTPA